LNPRLLGYEPYDMRLCRVAPSLVAALTSADGRRAFVSGPLRLPRLKPSRRVSCTNPCANQSSGQLVRAGQHNRLIRRTRAREHQIRRLRQAVQDRPLRSGRWAGIPQPSTRDRRCPAAWQQSRPDGTDLDRPRPGAGFTSGRRGMTPAGSRLSGWLCLGPTKAGMRESTGVSACAAAIAVRKAGRGHLGGCHA
jgi:hypothetical protein